MYSTVKLRTKVPTLNVSYEVEANPLNRPSDSGKDYSDKTAADFKPGTEATGAGAGEGSVVHTDGSVISAPMSRMINGNLVTDRIMSDTNRIAGMIAWNTVDILWAIFYVLGVFGAMFLLNPGLAAAVILIVPVISLLTAWFQDRILRWNRRVRKLSSRITGAFNEGIMGAMTTKTLVREEASAAEFRELTGAMRTASILSLIHI